MQINQLEQLEKHTFRLVDSTLVLNDDCLDFLQQLRAEKNLTLLRVNMHQSTENNVQQMLMILSENIEIKPHFQKNGYVSYAVLRGTSQLKINCDAPNEKAIDLSKEHNSFIRMPRHTVRKMTATSKNFVFVETCDGPFRKENTIWI